MLFRSAKKKELEATEKRIAELSAIFKRLYEDSVTGRISDERFTELSADYEAEQKERKERAAAIRAELSKAQEATVNAEKMCIRDSRRTQPRKPRKRAYPIIPVRRARAYDEWI